MKTKITKNIETLAIETKTKNYQKTLARGIGLKLISRLSNFLNCSNPRPFSEQLDRDLKFWYLVLAYLFVKNRT